MLSETLGGVDHFSFSLSLSLLLSLLRSFIDWQLVWLREPAFSPPLTYTYTTFNMSNQLFTRQSAAELDIENKNEASFFAQYKWVILGGLFGFLLQVFALWWLYVLPRVHPSQDFNQTSSLTQTSLRRRRNKKARQAADEENVRLGNKAFDNVGVTGNAWGAGAGQNVWGARGAAGNPGVVRHDDVGVADVPPAYDGRGILPGGKI